MPPHQNGDPSQGVSVSFSDEAEIRTYQTAGELSLKVSKPVKSTIILHSPRDAPPGLSIARALARAKVYARACGRDTIYGWPMFWSSSGAMSLEPTRRLASAEIGPELFQHQSFIPRGEAEKYVVNDKLTASRIHFGDIPEFCPRIITDQGWAVKVSPKVGIDRGPINRKTQAGQVHWRSR